MKTKIRAIRLMAALLATIFVAPSLQAYSVLTHEQIVDLLWKDQIQPMLLKRFPQATPDQLREAHAYAYGGSMIQDMGYYPFGNKYFSDLVHYVRSGDFVEALVLDASDLNEFAFALGALSHYASDNSGHPTINQVVAIQFPKLRKKYGDEVTYVDDPKAHIRTEFGFDMVQVAKNRYTSDRYHDFIGFEVAKPLLERAFQETYDMPLSDLFGSLDTSIGTFRRAISKIIPEMTRVALLSRHDVIVKETPNFKKKEFLFYLSRTNYEKEWGKGYRRPSVWTRILAFFLNLIPKVGPFAALDFKIPTQKAEDLYIGSVDLTVQDYASLLRMAGDQQIELANTDFDTGRAAYGGEYALSDKTYARLLDDQSKKDFQQTSPALRANILQFFENYKPPEGKKKNKKDQIDWEKAKGELEKLKAAAGAAVGESGEKR